MVGDLRVSFIQADLGWQDPARNREKFTQLISRLGGSSDAVFLPEMFTTGFTLAAAECAEDMDGVTVAWMQTMALETGSDIVGSCIIRDSGTYRNRLIWAKPGGELYHYDKRHLFRYAGENEVYQPGKEKLIVPCKGWNICPLVCYDLRFGVWSANVGKKYDLAVYVANWPAPRAHHWRALLLARAIENQAYVAGINRVGTDGNGVPYSGGSAVIDPAGKDVLSCGEGEETVTVVLDRGMLDTYRFRFPVWKDISYYR